MSNGRVQLRPYIQPDPNVGGEPRVSPAEEGRKAAEQAELDRQAQRKWYLDWKERVTTPQPGLSDEAIRALFLPGAFVLGSEKEGESIGKGVGAVGEAFGEAQQTVTDVHKDSSFAPGTEARRLTEKATLLHETLANLLKKYREDPKAFWEAMTPERAEDIAAAAGYISWKGAAKGLFGLGAKAISKGGTAATKAANRTAEFLTGQADKIPATKLGDDIFKNVQQELTEKLNEIMAAARRAGGEAMELPFKGGERIQNILDTLHDRALYSLSEATDILNDIKRAYRRDTWTEASNDLMKVLDKVEQRKLAKRHGVPVEQLTLDPDDLPPGFDKWPKEAQDQFIQKYPEYGQRKDPDILPFDETTAADPDALPTEGSGVDPGDLTMPHGDASQFPVPSTPRKPKVREEGGLGGLPLEETPEAALQKKIASVDEPVTAKISEEESRAALDKITGGGGGGSESPDDLAAAFKRYDEAQDDVIQVGAGADVPDPERVEDLTTPSQRMDANLPDERRQIGERHRGGRGQARAEEELRNQQARERTREQERLATMDPATARQADLPGFQRFELRNVAKFEPTNVEHFNPGFVYPKTKKGFEKWRADWQEYLSQLRQDVDKTKYELSHVKSLQREPGGSFNMTQEAIDHLTQRAKRAEYELQRRTLEWETKLGDSYPDLKNRWHKSQGPMEGPAHGGDTLGGFDQRRDYRGKPVTNEKGRRAYKRPFSMDDADFNELGGKGELELAPQGMGKGDHYMAPPEGTGTNVQQTYERTPGFKTDKMRGENRGLPDENIVAHYQQTYGEDAYRYYLQDSILDGETVAREDVYAAFGDHKVAEAWELIRNKIQAGDTPEQIAELHNIGLLTGKRKLDIVPSTVDQVPGPEQMEFGLGGEVRAQSIDVPEGTVSTIDVPEAGKPTGRRSPKELQQNIEELNRGPTRRTQRKDVSVITDETQEMMDEMAGESGPGLGMGGSAENQGLKIAEYIEDLRLGPSGPDTAASNQIAELIRSAVSDGTDKALFRQLQRAGHDLTSEERRLFRQYRKLKKKGDLDPF